jgi:deoxyribodipyrimidine photolyase-related protein
MVESIGKLRSKAWHIQRAHLVITAMRRFAAELRAEGFIVDYRRCSSLAQGLHEHRVEFEPTRVIVMEPASWSGLELVRSLHCHVVRSNQFLCHPDEFASWASGRKSFKMEDFYRTQRVKFGYLMDGDEPVGGRWNLDTENRQPPPRDGLNHWPSPKRSDLDSLDDEVLADIGPYCHGDRPTGIWATDRVGALLRLDHFLHELLPQFGPHEDAMTTSSWHLAHSLLSPYLNLGLLTPKEVCDAVRIEYERGRVPLASAEGFIRQVIGWREYVWGLYWLWMPDYAEMNVLEANDPLPACFNGQPTQMRCVSTVLAEIKRHGWAHHIQRLMIIGNLSLISGCSPQALTEWMWANFVDGAEWVMVPNVIGMSQFADGGKMATKPYASGGAYIDKMSDYCKGCRYKRTERTGPDACPFTTLYWDFMARHEARLGRNPRVAQQVRAAFKLSDLDAVRARAVEVRSGLAEGTI